MPTNNREALLNGAKRCLYEKGYGHTTARDIATAAGVSLAAIGYHYGSTEALMNAAMMVAIEEWGDEMGRALGSAVDPALDPVARFEAAWTALLASFETHRPLWVASFEVFAQIERAPEVRRFLADAIQEGIRGLAELFQGLDSTADPRLAWTVGSFYQALLTGVMAQWMLNPERAPTGRDLAEALRLISGGLGSTPRAPDNPDAATPGGG
jgi:AcrR family transcriptional regulator